MFWYQTISFRLRAWISRPVYIHVSLLSCAEVTHGSAPRRVASRHVTSREKQHKPSERKRRGGDQKKKKPTEKHQQHEPLPASGATAQAADMLGSSVTLGNTRPDSWRWDHGAGHARLPLIYLESECWEVKEGGGREREHSRPRKHCRVINIPKHNAAALTAARRRHFRSHVSAFGDDMLGREFGARIGSCFGQKAPGRKNEEVAQVRAAKGARRQLECARCVSRARTHARTRQPPADDCVHFSQRS